MAPVIHTTTEEEHDWLKYYNEQLKKTGETFIASAEKFTDIFTAINAVYLALLAFTGVTSGGKLVGVAFPASLIFLIPIVPWIIGMAFLNEVRQPFFTRISPNSPSDIRNALIDSNVQKGKLYSRGIFCFSVGILCIIFVLAFGLYLQSVPAEKPQPYDVQFVIAGDQVQYLRQVPVDFVAGTNRTVTLTMVDASGTEYVVKTPAGDIAAINKSWVKIVVKK